MKIKVLDFKKKILDSRKCFNIKEDNYKFVDEIAITNISENNDNNEVFLCFFIIKENITQKKFGCRYFLTREELIKLENLEFDLFTASVKENKIKKDADIVKYDDFIRTKKNDKIEDNLNELPKVNYCTISLNISRGVFYNHIKKYISGI